MNPSAVRAIEEADWKTLGPKLLKHAHYELTKYEWRGLSRSSSPEFSPAVEGRTAEDFVTISLQKIADGTRAFKPELSLLTLLKHIIESEVSNYWKKQAKAPQLHEPTSKYGDPEISNDIESLRNSESKCVSSERKGELNRLLDEFEQSIENDEELYLTCLCFKDEIYKNALIEKQTGIPAIRISELKRKLRSKLDTFISSKQPHATPN